jgi:tRNA pseudouridine13 synthase
VARFQPGVDTFVVEEIPAYRPVGTGEHTFLWIEKRDLTTPEAEKRLARALGVELREVGHAGMKDRYATTRQYLSLPRVDPERALAFVDGQGEKPGDGGEGGGSSSGEAAGPAGVTATAPRLRVLEAARHGNKLRMGHLHGNRFEVVLQDVGPGEAAVIEGRLRQLAETGLPNRFGDQRFGAAGDNVARAIAILRGELHERDRRRRFFLLSALQSAIFNRALELRAERGGLLTVLAGDVLQKRVSGGLFVCEDPAVDGPRVAAKELVPTGPMPGNKEREPPPGTPARALEDEALASVGIRREELAPLGRDLPGARRPVVVHLDLGEPAVSPEGEGGEGAGAGRLRLRFSLPAGSYATVLVEALGLGSPHGSQVPPDAA